MPHLTGLEPHWNTNFPCPDRCQACHPVCKDTRMRHDRVRVSLPPNIRVVLAIPRAEVYVTLLRIHKHPVQQFICISRAVAQTPIKNIFIHPTHTRACDKGKGQVHISCTPGSGIGCVKGMSLKMISAFLESLRSRACRLPNPTRRTESWCSFMSFTAKSAIVAA